MRCKLRAFVFRAFHSLRCSGFNPLNGGAQQVTLNSAYPMFDVAVTPVADALVEGAESVSLSLQASSDYLIASPSTRAPAATATTGIR